MNVWVNITSSQSLRKWFEPSIVGSFSNFQLNFNSNQLWNLKIVKLKSVNLYFYDFHCENIQCSASDWIERLPLSFSSIDHWGKKQLVITWQRIIEKSDCCSAWGTIDRHTKEKCFYWMISTWNQNMDNNMLRNGNTGCLISNQKVKKKNRSKYNLRLRLNMAHSLLVCKSTRYRRQALFQLTLFYRLTYPSYFFFLLFLPFSVHAIQSITHALITNQKQAIPKRLLFHFVTHPS